ncbi:MAG: hydrolase [Oscillospiraceae bacterium]|nr:hydrolase [Oscillospiraceae bacterium]
MKRMIPEINGKLRCHMVRVPDELWQASGIKIFGTLIKAVVFSTDIAIIRNSNADAVIAVYPFTAQSKISEAIIAAAEVPVFVGVGGGITTGQRAVNMAFQAENQGARAVVLNAPTKNSVIKAIYEIIDIPIIVTVLTSNTKTIQERLEAGATILNVSAAEKTPQVVKQIRTAFPEATIMATGGPSSETIKKTIDAGANAITWTPPPNSQLTKGVMRHCREGIVET